MRPVWHRQVRVRRACVHGRRRRVSFTLKCSVSAPARVHVATGGKSALLSIAFLSVCVGDVRLWDGTRGECRRIRAHVGCRLEARVRVLWARREKKVSVMSLITCLVLTVRLGCCTPSHVRCGVGCCECIERLCTSGGDELCTVSFLLFTVKGGVSAPAHVRVGTGGQGASLPIASLSVCVGWHRARVEA